MEQLSTLRVPSVASGTATLFEGFAAGDLMWTGDGDRSVTVEIRFDSGFAAPPHVQIGVSALDVDQSRNLRYRVEVEEVTRAGFIVTAHLWQDTRIGRFAISWIAIGNQDAGVALQHAGDRAPR